MFPGFLHIFFLKLSFPKQEFIKILKLFFVMFGRGIHFLEIFFFFTYGKNVLVDLHVHVFN